MRGPLGMLAAASTGSLLETAFFAAAWALIPTLGMLAWYVLKMLRLKTYVQTAVRVPEYGRRSDENETFKQVTHWLSEYLTERGNAGQDLDSTSIFSRHGETVWGIAEDQTPRCVEFEGTRLWITLSSGSDSRDAAAVRNYTVTVYGVPLVQSQRFPSQREAVIRRFLAACQASWREKEKKRTRIFVADCPNQFQSRWRELGSRPSRPRKTVVFSDSVVDVILRDVQAFMSSEEWYYGHGVPYRRGYLFHGLPGCGKSSLITALAGEVQASIYIVNLSNKDITDERLLALVANAAKHSFLLLEDVDRAWSTDSKITFSGLLNAIDGAAGQEGKLLFMTTNHYDKLDPALVRPGRVDHTVYIPPACPKQAKGLFENFFPPETFPGRPVAALADAFADNLATVLKGHPGTNISVAELQGLLLHNKTDPDSAAAALCGYIPLYKQQDLRKQQQRNGAASEQASDSDGADSGAEGPAAAVADGTKPAEPEGPVRLIRGFDNDGSRPQRRNKPRGGRPRNGGGGF